MKIMRGLVLICILASAAGPQAAFARQDKNVDKAAAKSRAEEVKKAENPGAVPQVGDKKDEAKKEEPKKP